MTLEPIEIRDARDDDAEGLVALIGGCFAEYPGCVLDVDGELPELRHIATTFASWGGRFWVATLGGRVVGSVGLTPASDPSGVELKKLYVDKSARRMGLGTTLCTLVESSARQRRATFVDLWSDTRFRDAHRLYEKRGYVRGPMTRNLFDKSNSVEFYFRLSLETAREPVVAPALRIQS